MFLLKLLLFILIVIIVKKIIYKIECNMIFLPTKLDAKYDYNLVRYENKLLQETGIPIKIYEKNILTKDKEKINMIYFKNPNSSYHIIFSHGNAGNISNRFDIALKLVLIGSVILFDYRGYGKSTGSPNEEGVYEDINSVWKYFVNIVNISPNNIILYGESLGCSVVSWLGQKLCKNTKRKPRAIIMQSGFSSLSKIASDLFPKFLVYFLKSKFDNEKYVKTIGYRIPIMIAHSHNDEMINIYHKDELIKANGTDRIKFYPIKGLHNSPDLDRNYFLVLETFIELN